MRFRFLLYILFLKLKHAARKNKDFTMRVKKRDFTIVIRTADKKISRVFSAKGGRLESKQGLSPNPDFEMVWDDAGYAFRTLFKNKDQPVLEALGTSRMKLVGNVDYFFWFTELLKLMNSNQSIKHKPKN